MGKRVKKEHLKDIDFRTRRQRQDEWQKDWMKWLEDLEKRDGVVASTQFARLIEWWGMVEEDAEGAIEHIEIMKSEADIATEEGLSTYLLACSCLWYLTPID